MKRKPKDIFNLKNVIKALVFYDLKSTPFIESTTKDSTDTVLKGLCDTEKKIIFIDSNQDFTTRQSVLVHEILHSISDLEGLNLNEKEVSKLEHYFFKTIIQEVKNDRKKSTKSKHR